MKRLEKAGRQRKKAPIGSTIRDVGGVVDGQKTHQVDTSRCSAMGKIIAPEQQTSGKMQLFTTRNNLDSKYSSGTLIAHTVTDGGSAENSPVPMYWKYEV